MKYDFAALRFTEDGNIADRVYWYLCDFPVKEGEGVLAPVGAHDRLQFARVERTLAADEAHAPYDVRLIKRVEAKYGARRLALSCAKNCRDLGGLRYDGKRFTRYGAFLRSDFPVNASEGDRAVLRDYGVTALVDLREEGEKTENVSGFRVFSHPVTASVDAEYTELAESEGLFAALRTCAAEKGCVLFGCGMGKDRTGTLAALLLLLAGVGEEDVRADFFLSVSAVGETKAELRERRLQTLLTAVKARGGIEAYLYDIGLSRGEIAVLKEKLR